MSFTFISRKISRALRHGDAFSSVFQVTRSGAKRKRGIQRSIWWASLHCLMLKGLLRATKDSTCIHNCKNNNL